MRKIINCKACGKELTKGVNKCVRCGKDQRNFLMKHKIITFILFICVLVGLVKAIGSNGGSTSGTTATVIGSSNENIKKETTISFSNILITSNIGITTVNGEAKSNDGKKHSFTLKVSFYDKDKKLLGTAVGTVNDLEPTDTKIFTAMATEDYSKSDSYKVEVDTLVESLKSDVNSKITFSNLVARGGSGTTLVNGEVKNADQKEHSFILVVGFYDKDNKLIGTAMDTMNNLEAGATKTYTAMSIGDFSRAAKTKVHIDSLVQ